MSEDVFIALECLAKPGKLLSASERREAPLSFRFFAQFVSQNTMRPTSDGQRRDHQI
jgi:hypothetical protein